MGLVATPILEPSCPKDGDDDRWVTPSATGVDGVFMEETDESASGTASALAGVPSREDSSCSAIGYFRAIPAMLAPVTA